jgi:hypothetical protein
MLGVVQLECQAEHRGDRRERDVALVPVEPDTGDLATLPLAATDHAGIGNRGRIRTDTRTGQGKAGNLFAAGEPWQVVVTLFVGPVVQQQLGRPE